MEVVYSKQYRIDFLGLRKCIRNPAISRSAKIILVDILLYAGIDGVGFPSHETLGFNQNLSLRQITNLTNELKKFGVIKWTRGGFGGSNIYSINSEIYFSTEIPNRKYTSSKSGNPLPLQTGNQLPTKVVSKQSQSSSSHVQQIFEKTSNKKLGKTESELLNKLCEEYSEAWVEDAIKQTQERNLPYLTPNYLNSILEDWRAFGKPTPKPIFIPCHKGKCEDGGWIEGNVYYLCDCKVRHNEEIEQWKKNNGRLLNNYEQ